MAKIKAVEDSLENLAETSRQWFDNLLQQKHGDLVGVAKNPIIEMYQEFFNNGKAFLEEQQRFYESQLAKWQQIFDIGEIVGDLPDIADNDRRFTNPEWQTNPFFAYLHKSYVHLSDYLMQLIDLAKISHEDKERVRFFVKQYLDAIAPSNFALTNPEVIKSAIESNGATMLNGIKNMALDLENGYIAMTDEKMFAVGKNLAVTDGAVVYKNELIELIEYAPTTKNVASIPILLVPPCINKYYILDLQQENSFVKHLVDSGFHVFLISWRSADFSVRSLNWGDYIKDGVVAALRVVREIAKVEKVNALGYCVGGVILTTAALFLKERGDEWINSMTHLTVMLDHSNPGDMKYFVNKDLLGLEESETDGGIVSGRVIGQIFAALRANELIWNYWINNYLLGKTPQPFDILYWNNDAVDLPVLMHSFLLKQFYVKNSLVKGRLIIDKVKMDLTKLNYPMYLFAAQKDHIVPWDSVYKTTQLIKTNIRFVLGASGHTAGVVNPSLANKRNYWVNNKMVADHLSWFATAKKMPGSWWNDYSDWLSKYSGEKMIAKTTMGSKKYPAQIAAPGEYVLAKAMPVSIAMVE